MASASEIVRSIDEHRMSRGGSPSSWYAGIASQPRGRLFNDHCVDEQNGMWKYIDAGNSSIARSAEETLLNMGYDGGEGGGDYDTRYVYAYKKSGRTNP